jgi:hypothetical protein
MAHHMNSNASITPTRIRITPLSICLFFSFIRQQAVGLAEKK